MINNLFMTTQNTVQQFIARWKSLRTNRIIHLGTYLSLIFSVIGLVCIGIFWNKLPAQVPIWYSKPWGVERLASSALLFLLPGSCIIFTVINMILASYLTIEYLVFSQILSIGSLVISLLSMITLLKIILLVI